MKYARTMSIKSGKTLTKIVSALLLTLVMGVTISGTASAAPGRDRGWDRHAHEAYRYHHAHPVYAPGYVEAPPVVYAPPPPQPAGINLIIPFNIH